MVGFEIDGPKNTISKIMLQSIVDFTIPESTCNLFYQNLNGEI